MEPHWHAFHYTGQERPKDSLARDPQAAAPPNEIAMFFRKPATMRASTFTDPDEAHTWLKKQLTEAPPPPSAVPVAKHLKAAADRLQRGTDAYIGYYTATGRFLVRALLTCPRKGERCPQPVSGSAGPEPDRD